MAALDLSNSFYAAALTSPRSLQDRVAQPSEELQVAYL